MIDINDLRQRPQAYKDACSKKRIEFDVDSFLALDAARRALQGEVEKLRAAQNAASKEIPKLQGEEKTKKLEDMKSIAASAKERDEEYQKVQSQWEKDQLRIPGIPLDRVPQGKDDTENVEISRWGEQPKFSFRPKSHIELGKDLGLMDFERGVKIAGARNYFLIGDGARLQHAVLSFTIDHLLKKGFTLMEPPHIVNYLAMMGTGYFPGGEEQAYHLDERDDKFLIGTSEVSVASFHANEILRLEELPKRYVGYSPCYRREAGSYGKDTQGLYRIHQFYKVEQVVICEASLETSLKLHAEILKNAEEVVQALGLPYRVVDVCTGDMGQGQVYKNDIECWMPSRNSYGETHSCSTLLEFQARRLSIKYKDKDGKNKFCHTLNNTCIASPRILIPIIENNQNADGSVEIPAALRPFMGNQEKITRAAV